MREVKKGAKCCTSLKQLERIIARSKGHGPRFWRALARIYAGKKYRPQFHSFAEYCWHRWGIKKRMKQYYLAAHAVVRDCKITHEVTLAIVRPLLSLSFLHRKMAWALALSMTKDGRPTAAIVKLAAARFTKKMYGPWTMRAAKAVANRRFRSLLKQAVHGSTLEQRESFYSALPQLLGLAIEYTREAEPVLVQLIPEGEELTYDVCKRICLNSVKLE